jgi:hypothetical protein
MKMKYGFLVFTVFIITGCIAARPLTATPEKVSYSYNKNLTPHDTVVADAERHCSNYGKTASLLDTAIAPNGYDYTRTFTCE